MLDVVIIGGSYAGLSAALALGRARRNVVLIDNANPCNKTVAQAQNFAGMHNPNPDRFRETALQEIAAYPTIQIVHGSVIAARQELDNTFSLATNDAHYSSRKLLFASGVQDVMPDIVGFQECWGHSILHCPYCHGYEVVDKTFGIFGNAAFVETACLVLRQWSKNLIVFTNGDKNLSPETIAAMKNRGICIVNSEITKANHEDGQIKSITAATGATYKLDAVFIKPQMLQKCDHVEALGCKLNDNNLIEATEWGATNVHGIYAAGDCTNHVRTIAHAISSGNKTAIGINNELCAEDWKRA
jgi:thioredoxin reductase